MLKLEYRTAVACGLIVALTVTACAQRAGAESAPAWAPPAWIHGTWTTHGAGGSGTVKMSSHNVVIELMTFGKTFAIDAAKLADEGAASISRRQGINLPGALLAGKRYYEIIIEAGEPREEYRCTDVSSTQIACSITYTAPEQYSFTGPIYLNKAVDSD